MSVHKASTYAARTIHQDVAGLEEIARQRVLVLCLPRPWSTPMALLLWRPRVRMLLRRQQEVAQVRGIPVPRTWVETAVRTGMGVASNVPRRHLGSLALRARLRRPMPRRMQRLFQASR
jgi:hypothetical protein